MCEACNITHGNSQRKWLQWMLTASNPDTGVFNETRHRIFLLQELVASRGITEWTTWLHALSSILIPSHSPPINLTDERSQRRECCDVLLYRDDLLAVAS